MDIKLQEISNQQKATWNKSSSGWKKWDDLTMDFLKPYGNEIIKQLNLKDSDIVLDVAAGTGEPGLTIASRLKTGKVIITDIADDMLTIAQENAVRQSIQNVEFRVCDVSELPFENDTFDAISCRMGFMFFPDMMLALKEMVRVLKPDGTLAASVWSSPEKNFWVAGPLNVIKKYMELPVLPPGSPGMFRCAKEGLIASLFAEAGLKNITQIEIPGTLNCQTAETYWSFSSEVVGPVVNSLSQANAETVEKIKNEILQTVHQKYTEGNVRIDACAWVISGQK